MCYDTLVYLGLGSNLGDSRSILTRALKSIAALEQVRLLKVSRFYQTAPVSPLPQRDFLNAACLLHTTLTPHALYAALHRIEMALGKRPKPKYAPRLIDIDILLFGMHFIQDAFLCIPHPHWRERPFVLKPLSDLTDKIIYPLDNRGNSATLEKPFEPITNHTLAVS